MKMKNENNGYTSFKKRRGVIIFTDKYLFENINENVLHAIFSNFFPLAMQGDHSTGIGSKRKMYGFSKHFREIDEGEIAPEYEMVLKSTLSDGVEGVEFVKMVEVKTEKY